jgi:predicted TIM-barrel fold metal-dependent hydrolase
MSHNGFKVIDSDMHIIEPADLWQRYMDPRFKDGAPLGTSSNIPRDIGVYLSHGMPSQHVDAQPHMGNWFRALRDHMTPVEHEYEFAARRNFDGVSQLEAMDREGVDVAFLYPSRGLFVLGVDSSESAGAKGIDPALATAIARAYNDWLYDFMAPDRKRMYGAAMVAPHDVKGAAAETRRCVEKFGFKAIFLLPGQINKRPWHDSYYDPLWAQCEQLGIPVVFHGGGPDHLNDFGQGLYDKLMLWHTFSHSLGPMAALVSFAGGGVLERFPRLRAGFLEASCSWAPWLLARLDDHYEEYIGRFEVKLSKLPSEHFRDNCYVSVEADEKPARLLVDYIGDSNVVFSTDYPHPDSKFPHAVEKFLSMPLADEVRRKFLWDNCARLYGID